VVEDLASLGVSADQVDTKVGEDGKCDEDEDGGHWR